MRRACTLLLLLTALLVACGKYGPPRRVRPEPAAPAAAVEPTAAPLPVVSPAEREAESEAPEPTDAQEGDH